MAIIYETGAFVVQSAEQPLVDRTDGGHITIDPKFQVSTRQELSPQQAIELMRLTMVTGEAMTTIMIAHGIDIGRINYQDNGNWSVFKPGGPQLHYHLYGRARSAVRQPFGESLYLPARDKDPLFYNQNQPLTASDVDAIREEIERLLALDKYSLLR